MRSRTSSAAEDQPHLSGVSVCVCLREREAFFFNLARPNSAAVGRSSDACNRLRAAFERRGNHLKGFKNFYLEAKARIWP